MSFKVIDPRSGTKGVLHQWRHTGSKPRKVLRCVFKHLEDDGCSHTEGSPVPQDKTAQEEDSSSHLWHPARTGAPLNIKFCFWDTSGPGTVVQPSKDGGHPQHQGGNSSANALKRPTGAAVSYQAQQTYFVGNICVHVQNFHFPKQETGLAKKLKLDWQQKISAPSFTLDKITSYKFISTPFRKFYIKPVVDGWVFRCAWFTCVFLIYFSYYFTLSINSKVVSIAINSKSFGLNLYTSSKLLILDLKWIHGTR